jgi:serine-type D-Ala-D-Ala carboxypeptidase (penicillin-binding protein 5/6)
MPPPKAWILVDVDTGNVIDAGNDHTPLPPASLTKVITALAVSNLAPDTPVTVSAQAAAAPADKIGLKQGQVWTADELFHALLISSANDAAIALAQQVGGSVAGFEPIFERTAVDLGMVDNPVLQDPAGLDGSEGVDGGNLVSARDLAIAGRALLADPYLAAIVATPVYSFEGPGNIGHRLTSHNYSFLATYTGAIGIKTGFTDRAGTCLMAAARVNGRTMLAVVMHSPNPTLQAKQLLNQGFATPVSAETTADQLPPVNLAALRPQAQAVPERVSATVALPPPGATGPNLIATTPAPQSFRLLSAAGALALLLCLGALIGSAEHRRRRRPRAPNLWVQRDPGAG